MYPRWESLGHVCVTHNLQIRSIAKHFRISDAFDGAAQEATDPLMTTVNNDQSGPRADNGAASASGTHEESRWAPHLTPPSNVAPPCSSLGVRRQQLPICAKEVAPRELWGPAQEALGL